MFFRKKKNKENTEIEVVQVQERNPEEIMGLREVVSVESLKGHLVDLMEENERLKKEKTEREERGRREDAQRQKDYELKTTLADQYKKQVSERDKEIEKLKREIDRLDEAAERWKRKAETATADMELARRNINKREEEVRAAKSASEWLRGKLKACRNWRGLTKTQLIEIIEEAIMEDKEKDIAAGVEEECIVEKE